MQETIYQMLQIELDQATKKNRQRGLKMNGVKVD